MSERIDLNDVLASIRAGRRAISDERAAFEVFRSRLAEFDPTEPTAGSRSFCSRRQGVSTARIETAYRETITGVPHYHSTYNQTYTRSVVSTLGAELGAKLVESPRVERETVETIRSRAAERVAERDRLIDAIDVERGNVRELADRLADGRTVVERRISIPERELSIDEYWALGTRLASIERKCHKSLNLRRRHCRRHRTEGPGEHDTVRAFLYRSYETNEPVLDAIETVARAVRVHRERMEQRMTDSDGADAPLDS